MANLVVFSFEKHCTSSVGGGGGEGLRRSVIPISLYPKHF